MIMKKIQLKRLFFRLSHVRSSRTTVFCRVDFSPATTTTAENRAFDLMWISKHHKPVFRFPARLPGLVAKAGCDFLRIPRLSTATFSHFLRRPEFCCWVLSYPSPQNLWQIFEIQAARDWRKPRRYFTLHDTVVFTAKWSRTTFECRF